MNENRSPIPSRLYNAAKGGHVAGTADIIDDNKGKTQEVINKETDSALENRYTKNETYSKTELNNLITTPEQQYVNLTAKSGDTLEDIFDGIAGAANTIYRVGSWDGSQYNTTKYAEYGWTGTNFVPLDVKEYGIDDEPTSGSDNLVKSGGVNKKLSELEAKVYMIEDITINTSSEEMVLDSMIRLDGSTWDVGGYCHTQKIDIKGINTISYNNIFNANAMGYIVYDANNNVIGSNTDNTRDGVLTIADYQGAKYVLFNGTNSVGSGRMSISYSKMSTKTKMEENSENIDRNTEDIKNNVELINLVNGKLYQTAVVQKGINSADIAESNKGIMIRVDGSTWNVEGYCNTGKISTDNISSFAFFGLFGGAGCGWIIYDAQNNVIANNINNITEGTIDLSIYPTAKYILFNGITISISILYYEQKMELKTDSIERELSHHFYCGSSRQYKKIKDAVADATKYMDSIIYLDAETFDIVAEYGQSYLDSADANEKGMVLSNRVRIVGASGSKIVFNYTGSNTNIHTYFSVFNAGIYGFTLENITIESINCRYSVHDERGSSTDAYHNHYINCRMIHDSSETSWGAHQAIGGGTGCFGEIVIDGGYYESVGGALPITYHLSGTTRLDAKCDITIKNVYINGGTVVWNYGASTTMSRFVVNGCKMAVQPEVRIDSQYPTNVELIAWGNSIGL